jgi:hypothetical protein
VRILGRFIRHCHPGNPQPSLGAAMASVSTRL